MIWEEACHVMGVIETATTAEIKEQYLYKVQLLHPDKTLDKPEKIRQKAEEELIRINEAYKFLSNEKNNPRTPPKLEISPLAVRFADVALHQKKVTTIDIGSIGGPFTNCWIDNSPAPWLTAQTSSHDSIFDTTSFFAAVLNNSELKLFSISISNFV